jgi:Cof subfamily protein (haloacid dehalogenase superfamily)
MTAGVKFKFIFPRLTCNIALFHEQGFRGRGDIMRKLLVTDIDGTLAHRDNIPEEVVQACRVLRQEGWEIIVATGRILASARGHMKSVGALPEAIVYDGARIMSDETGQEIWGVTIPPETVEGILRTIWDLAPGVQVFGDEKVFCRPDDTLARKYFSSLGVPVIDDLACPRAIRGVFRVIIHGQADSIDEIGEGISAAVGDSARAVFAGDGFLDILGPGISKGAALDRLLGSLVEEGSPVLVAAAGDHLNDMELLEYAHISITMEDAREPLRAMADVILPPASEKGFSRILGPLRSLAGPFEALSREGRLTGRRGCKPSPGGRSQGGMFNG